MNTRRTHRLFQFFSYVTALYWLVIWISFITMYFPAAEQFNVTNILEHALLILHIVCHASVIAVVHYLGRRKLFWFLCVLLICTTLTGISMSVEWLSTNYQVIFTTNVVNGLLYIGTLFSIRKTPFGNIFIWLGIAEAVLMTVGCLTILFFPSFYNIYCLFGLAPVTVIFLLLQRARQHLVKTELETSFLES